MAKSLFRRFPTDDLIWDSPDADESDGGPMFFADILAQQAWEIGEDFWEAVQQGPGFVDLAASLAGSQVVTGNLSVERPLGATLIGAETVAGALAVARSLAAALAGVDTSGAALNVLRGLGAALGGSQADAAALGVLRSLSAAVVGSDVVLAGLERLTDLAAGAEGSGAATAALGVLRDLIDDIGGGGGETTAELYVARALAAAAEAGLQITGALTAGEGEAASEPIVKPAPRLVVFFGPKRGHYWWQDDEEKKRREGETLAATFKAMAERAIEVDDMEILELA